ncbi:hypothetical protein GTV32_04815 [Gordonia sp. SID5947]|uniref:hypothetical protein n=1 Tax=Gordonia sp. SID5947 TaxID=2690315 RepID=UPI00136B5AE1|nr:hypothetical protein [Gordonia sp. SID5947]MYR05675.1 hypothetical protein [Gordonia sp. SID5947]
MTVNDAIPAADDGDLIEQSIEVEPDDAEDDSADYPVTNRDHVEDEADAFAPVTRQQRR